MVVRTSDRFYGNTQAHVLDYYNAGSFADVLANRVLDVKEKLVNPNVKTGGKYGD